MPSLASLDLIPQEVLEQIAFFTAIQNPVGPPSELLPLLTTCTTIYRRLSIEDNPYLYARIFEYKFDLRAPLRRLGSQVSAPLVLATELRKRCQHLKSIRARTSSRIRQCDLDQTSSSVSDLLWTSYLMMLENDGKNERQLRDYAEVETWLMEYWFDDEGASTAANMIMQDDWPPEDEKNCIAMWLFWLLLRPDCFQLNARSYRGFSTILKLTALAANRYEICQPSWAEFDPEPSVTISTSVVHFSETYHLRPPALASPAILSYLTLGVRMLAPRRVVNHTASHFPQAPGSLPLSTRRSEEWDADWQRCVNLGRGDYCRTLSKAYILGSLEGVWEGIFTYTEFTAYSSLLSGGAPPVLHNSLVAQHRQTWKLREYHLTSVQGDMMDGTTRLGPGDPLRAYFPPGAQIHEASDFLEVHDSRTGQDLKYLRSSHDAVLKGQVIDILVVGEGHSAWGQFSLYGRVRPWDGLISFYKEYVDGDRGQWLYRGFLVGNANGHISGRWRDTLSPSHVSGYEGCFVMSRRR